MSNTSRIFVYRRFVRLAVDVLEGVTVSEADKARTVAELRAALRPRSVKPMRREREKSKATARAAKNAETAAIREACLKRANGKCECGCGRTLGIAFLFEPEMDHFFSRRNGQSVATCWALCKLCHSQKTDNKPNAEYWLARFIHHCEWHGYDAEAEQARARLDSLALSRASAEAGKGAPNV